MKPKQIFFMGTGTVGRECLKILKNATDVPIEYLTVESEPIPTMEPLCRKLGILCRNLSSIEVKNLLMQQELETLIISAHNEYIFPKEVVKQHNVRLINFHNAYLPNYRGRNAPTWEIYEGAAYGGATWHEVEASIDTGGIIVQERVPIENVETALSLLMKCAKAGIKLMRENVGEFLGGDYLARSAEKKGRLYLAKELPNGGYLDTTWDMEQAYRFLRSMDYSPMNILPLPRVRLGDKVYGIEGYNLQKRQMFRKGERDSLKIQAWDGSLELVCNLREIKEIPLTDE
ncbi:formyltransferase family protein [Selenomonas sp. AE3005]|uniref:formyltransferase family protein n=1 Tax=Selenomonas sp. AE3005 TaxID=1485543 RepID=UPI0006907A33|nr:formyltransferase family protein [Selenomonas sp. AE3005]